MSSSKKLYCSGFVVDCSPCLSCSKWPLMVGIVVVKCLDINVGVRPGHPRKWLLLMALRKVSFVGEKQVAWRYDAKSFAVVSFRMITFIAGLW